ncbi:EAL domain-containing protein [Mitsuokella sp. AF21-1AC]|uniref:EAL domain-containing protein n=1 Tax=Mitsuokella sp. AF21-1AC TaxID=2292235 RepID=UPI001314870E|nr:EAL domain-containing protein [Mitsuokella sp. AF21-1AC]
MRNDDSCLAAVPGAFCLIRADESEHIAWFNDLMLSLYQCETAEEFRQLTGGLFRGMVLAEGYKSLAEQMAGWQQADSPVRYLDFEICTAASHIRRVDAYVRHIEREGLPFWSLCLIDAGSRQIGIKSDEAEGLMKRKAFYQAALQQSEKDRAEGCFGIHCPIYFNITNFKLYNSMHGYQAGDEVLRRMAKVLSQSLPGALIAHLAADSFIALAPAERLTERVEQICRKMNRLLDSPGIEVKCGLRFYRRQNKSPVISAFDEAKLACDAAKKDAGRSWLVYREEMGRQLLLKNYILTHFSEALRKGQIQIYLQPCMRVLTGKLCHVEALMRWDDPQHGLLSPGDIIPVLEESGLIHELDAFMIENAVKLLHYQQENDLPMLPISVNLSSLDFFEMGPFTIVEAATERYGISHEYLHFELTETAVVRDKGVLLRAIQKFHRAGYHVWLDDFGSGYSSLNVLKDYPFDMLKIDMVFLKRFSQKSQDIIESIVRMAKKIGIHTLAEGVETEEQLRFLRAIGCERIQGYHYGKPMTPETLHERCEKGQYVLETRAEARLYNEIGLADIPAHVAVALFVFDGENPSMLAGNEWFWNHSREYGVRDLRQMNQALHTANHPLRVRFLQHRRKVELLGRPQTMTFAEHERYFRVTLSRLAADHHLAIYQAQFHNVNMERQYDAKVRRFDTIMHNLCLMYQNVFFLNLQQDTCESLVGTHSWLAPDRDIHAGIHDFLTAYARRMVYPTDRSRFLAYASVKSFRQALLAEGRMSKSSCFRIRRQDGNYDWMRFDAVRIYISEQSILLCVQPMILEQMPGALDCLKRIADSYGLFADAKLSEGWRRDAMLWRSYSVQDKACVFWKDCGRRFLGANAAFLDFFGFKDVSEIVGRTDHELGLHILDSAFGLSEKQVIGEGRPQYRQLGECLAKGVPHVIRSDRYPFYEKGKISGLIGRFQELDESFDDYREAIRDQETGFVNYRGMLMAGIEFIDNYLQHGEDFTAVYFCVPAIDAAVRMYGQAFRRELLQRLAAEFRQAIVPGSVVAHIGSGRFLCFHKLIHEQRLRDRMLRLTNAVHNIRNVNGCPCTFYLQYAVGYGSETKSIEGLLQLLVTRAEAARKDHLGESIYIGDRIAFDREKFDHMDERVYMCDPETYDLVYINQAVARDFHLPEDFSCAGKKCYEVIVGGREPCEFCTNHLLRRDSFYTWTYHNTLSGIDYLLRDTLVPWRGKNYRFSMAINLNEYLARDIESNELLYREASINDALSIALSEEDPDKGLQKMLWKIGSELNADRISIFELEDDTGFADNTYEWCRAGVEPKKVMMQHIPLVPCYLYDGFRAQHIVKIPDYEKFLAENSGVERYLPDIRRFIAVPLKLSDKIIGHLQIINPKQDLFQVSSYLMMTLSRFIAIMIRNRDAVRELEHMGLRDQMTGLMNRRGLNNYFNELPKGISCAFIFGDVNGLKRMNDEHGHEAGDQLIKTVAGIMLKAQREAGGGHVFRMGGDEFLMIVEDIDEMRTASLVQTMRESFAAHHVSVALGSLVLLTPILDMDAVITKVDREMYKDKGHRYR